MSFSLEAAKDLLAKAKASNRLSHAYLIAGPEGSGKRELAAYLIQLADGKPVAADGAVPDLTALRSGFVSVVEPESKSRRISVESVREAERSLHLAAPSGQTKFVVINDADRMGVGAINAFLKTLEEPPAGSMLMLLTAQPQQLLDTIHSRCIRVSLHGSGPKRVRSEAEQTLIQALSRFFEQERAGVSAALGLSGIFNRLLKDEKSRISAEYTEALKEETAHYKQATEGDWLKRREAHYKMLTESEYLKQRDVLIELMLAWFGDALRQQQGGPELDLPECQEQTGELGRRLSPDALMERIRSVEALRSHLQTNVQEILALESAFIETFAG